MEAGFSQIRSHITIKHNYSTALTSVHLEITLGVNVGEQELIASIPEDVWTSKSSLRSRDPTWWYHMWLDLRKAGFHAHNGRPRFPLLIHSPIHRLTFHASLSAKNLPVCFCWGLFCRPSDVPPCARGGWASQCYGWTEQRLSWLGMATRLDSDISHWFSNFLWNFLLNRALFGPTDITVKFL